MTGQETTQLCGDVPIWVFKGNGALDGKLRYEVVVVAGAAAAASIGSFAIDEEEAVPCRVVQVKPLSDGETAIAGHGRDLVLGLTGIEM